MNLHLSSLSYIADHFADAGKMINLGKIVILEVGDFLTIFLNK